MEFNGPLNAYLWIFFYMEYNNNPEMIDNIAAIIEIELSQGGFFHFSS